MRRSGEGAGKVDEPPRFKIGYRPWNPSCVINLRIDIEYSSALY